jgi:hypothetical protein
VLSLSLLGAGLGAASVFGLSGVPAAIGWTLAAVICAGQIARRAPERAFLHGFLTGFIGSVLATLVQVALVPIYLERQPDIAAELATMATTLPPGVLILISAPFLGAVGGLVLGLLSYIAVKIETRDTLGTGGGDGS